MAIIVSGTTNFTLSVVLKLFWTRPSIYYIQVDGKASFLIRDEGANMGFLQDQSWPGSFMAKLQLEFWK